MHGLDAVLTLDVVLQRIVEQELGAACERLSAVWGSAVMLDVATGDILAMASVPDLDPADSSTWTRERQMVRSVQAVYSPGSTFKPVMMAAALKLGLVHPWTMVDCSPGQGRIPGRRKVVRDTHPVDKELTLFHDIDEFIHILNRMRFDRHQKNMLIVPNKLPTGSTHPRAAARDWAPLPNDFHRCLV